MSPGDRGEGRAQAGAAGRKLEGGCGARPLRARPATCGHGWRPAPAATTPTRSPRSCAARVPATPGARSRPGGCARSRRQTTPERSGIGSAHEAPPRGRGGPRRGVRPRRRRRRRSPAAVIDTVPDALVDIAMAPDGTGALVYTKGGQICVARRRGRGLGRALPRRPGSGGHGEQPARGGRQRRARPLRLRGRHAADLKWRLDPGARASRSAPEDAIRITEAANQIASDWDLDMNPAGVAYAAWVESDITLPRSVLAWRLRARRSGPAAAAETTLSRTRAGAATGPTFAWPLDAAGERRGPVHAERRPGLPAAARPASRPRRCSSTCACRPSWARRSTAPTASSTSTWRGTGSRGRPATATTRPAGMRSGVPVEGQTAGAAAVFDLHPAAENDNAAAPRRRAQHGRRACSPRSEPVRGVWAGTLERRGRPAAIRLDVSAHEPAATESPCLDRARTAALVAWTRDVEDGAAGPLEVRARVFTGSGRAPDELRSPRPPSVRRSSPRGSTSPTRRPDPLGDTAG